jgi:Uncharacterized protein conserved in bacteria (DUF2059)
MALLVVLRYQSPTMKQKLVVLLVLTLSAWSPVFSAPDTPETRRKEAQVDIAALSKAMTDAMVKNFTTEELKALADFYGSPVGKSAMQKFGAYMADIMPVVQAEIMKAAAKMNH